LGVFVLQYAYEIREQYWNIGRYCVALAYFIRGEVPQKSYTISIEDFMCKYEKIIIKLI